MSFVAPLNQASEYSEMVLSVLTGIKESRGNMSGVSTAHLPWDEVQFNKVIMS